ncbi:MAG: hypothetical protein P8M65_08180 [Roseibacillus sp.]|nr:hypothetical protein [Roseibacillus sp.]
MVAVLSPSLCINGFEFTQEELESGWEELQEYDEGLTDFELEVVSGGGNRRNGDS